MSMPSIALVRLRHVPLATWNTWGRLLLELLSMVPDTTSTSPLERVVTVGYQRPAFMAGRLVQVFENGSYREALGSPTLFAMCPPAKNRRPSARKACPVQKRS